jgi:hypothetical protein
MTTRQRREFHVALLDADTFEDLPGKWQAAILNAEQNRPKLRLALGRLVLCHRGVPTGGDSHVALDDDVPSSRPSA